jgi:glycosyltransferase involved in cell wall biosynthesis
VASTGGAAGDTVPAGAGLKVPPGDRDALGRALRRVITDRGLRESLSDAAWAAGQRLPRWGETAATVARVLREAAA